MFSGTVGELRLFEANGGWMIEGDTNGDSLADLVISVSTADGYTLTSNDFTF